MADSRRPGDRGKGMFAEVFGEMPLPESAERFDPSYDRYWTERLADSVFTEPARRRARGILPFISEGDTVLDVGCGTGETLELLRRERSIAGTGLDISQAALDVVSGKGFDAVQLDLTLPGTELQGTWDHIVLFEVAEHVIDAESLVRKLEGRYIKGLYITSPNLGYIAHRLRMIFGRFPVTYISDPREHVRYWSVKDFRHWSTAVGLPRPQVIGLRGKLNLMGLMRRWPSLLASEVLYRFVPEGSR
jgi:methionine biosynthesis protein MetW